MKPFPCLILPILAVGVFGSLKRDLSGNLKTSDSDTDEALQDWPRIVDTLAGTRGPKYPLIVNLNESVAADCLYSLGKLEVAAFHLMINNPNLTVDEMTIILNENIGPSETINGKPFRHPRVRIWYMEILGEKRSGLQQSGENTDSFLRQNVDILTNENGVMYLSLSPEAWDRFVYNSLIQLIVRTPPRCQYDIRAIISPAKSPREFQHVPFIIRAFVHKLYLKGSVINPFKKNRFRDVIDQFDSTSEVLDVILDYYNSIRTLFVIDMDVYARFVRCNKSQNMQTVADEWNSVFNEAHPPLFNSLYTPERVSFWCEFVQKRLFDGSGKLFGRLIRYKADGQMKEIEAIEFVSEEGTFDVLTWLSETTLIPAKITVDDVIFAWENRASLYEAPVIISPPVGQASQAPFNVAGFDSTHDLPLGKELSIPDFDSFAISPNRKRKILTHIFVGTHLNVYEYERVYEEYFRKVRQLPPRIVHELQLVNARRISTTAVAIVDKFKAHSPSEYSHITPEQVWWFYRVFLQRCTASYGNRSAAMERDARPAWP